MSRSASWSVRPIASSSIRIGTNRKKNCLPNISNFTVDGRPQLSSATPAGPGATMSFTNRISQALHDEHGATVALMERLEQMLARARRSGPPNTADSTVARLLSDLSTSMEAEVERHFAFEENHLFTYLEAMGDGGIGAHLTSEHAAMRPLAVRVAASARAAAANGFTPADCVQFMRLSQELGD